MSVTAGTRLGPYEVLGLIGAGGMGEVYRARDTRLDRTVAIKVLPAELAPTRTLRARFEREARADRRARAPPHLHAPRRRRAGRPGATSSWSTSPARRSPSG